MSAALSAAKMSSRQSAVGSEVWDGVSGKRASPSSCIKTVFDGRGRCGVRSDRGGAMFGAEHTGTGVDHRCPYYTGSADAGLPVVRDRHPAQRVLDAPRARGRSGGGGQPRVSPRPTPPRAGFSPAGSSGFICGRWRSMLRFCSPQSAGRQPVPRCWRCSSARCARWRIPG